VAFKDGTKSGGRQKGTQNKSVAARHEVMAKVNAALNELGEDSISGMKLLQEVIRHHDTPLDIKIQCSGLLLKHEMPLDQGRSCVVEMPPLLPGDALPSQMAVWWALYGSVPSGNDPEWDAAVKTILEKIPTMKKPETLS
jgi:hypothetical protein